MIFKKGLHQSVLGPAHAAFGAQEQSFQVQGLGTQLLAGSCWRSLGGFVSGGSGAASGHWTQGKASGLCLLSGQRSSHFTTSAWRASSAWDGLLTFIWEHHSQAEQVRSQAGFTDLSYIKKKMETYIENHYPLWAKKKAIWNKTILQRCCLELNFTWGPVQVDSVPLNFRYFPFCSFFFFPQESDLSIRILKMHINIGIKFTCRN